VVVGTLEHKQNYHLQMLQVEMSILEAAAAAPGLVLMAAAVVLAL
jgi:hypothetical protein